jgi:chemotaxis protein histidine kinase CheA/ActR/RegA family two-component response regulator
MIPAEALHNPADFAEAQLQEELRAMFAVDTQQYLESYFSIIAALAEPAWAAQIQELYRCIHTIKGGAVTVGADAVLQVSIVLEDLLSELRCLQTSPELQDGYLAAVLQEAGELLTASVDVTGDIDIAGVIAPTLERLQVLHQEIKQRYLPEWNENQQLYQEFAEQGFDLVILDLDIALEGLPSSGQVSKATVKAAQTTLMQLSQIGQDLEMGEGWHSLIQQGHFFANQDDLQLWREFWPAYLKVLKENARQGGQTTEMVAAFAEAFPYSTDDLGLLESPLAIEEAERVEGSEAYFAADLFADSVTADSATAESALEDSGFGQAFELDFAASDFSFLEESFLGEPEEFVATSEATSFAEESFDLEFLDPETLPTDALVPPALETEPTPAELVESESVGSASVGSASVESEADALETDLFGAFFTDIEPLEIHPGAQTEPTTADFEEPVSLAFEPVELDLPSELATFPEVPTPTELSESVADVSLLESVFDIAIPVVEVASAAMAAAETTAPEPPAIEDEATDLEWVIDQPLTTSEAPTATPTVAAKLPEPTQKTVQIPVPLERLDRSAQHLIATLMSSRTTQGVTQKLQAQLNQIHRLSQNSIDFVTELRRLQDNYALLNDTAKVAQGHDSESGLALERYRQGYLIINRLLESNLRLFELGAEAAVSAQAASKGLDSLERNLLNLQQTIEESRLVLFKTLAVRARAIVRDLTTRIGKPAQLQVFGEQLELDASTSQSLEPALLHLLRNAYDHGLESPEDRLFAGKPAQGTLKLSLQRRGSSYLLELKDDGGGMDANKIAQIAYAKSLPLTDTSSAERLLSVICQPGFSSQKEVSDISGRGVGMDVVASQVAALGGRLSLETQFGQGTTFRIQLPVPQLLVRCVLVKAGAITFALPADDIVTCTLALGLGAQAMPRQVTGATWQIQEGNSSVPGLDLRDYWSATRRTQDLADTAIALRIESQTALGADGIPETAWLLADDLLEQSELLITPLPEPMVAPQGMIGVSLQADGKFIPVLDAITLAEYLCHPERVAQAAAAATAATSASNRPTTPSSAKQTFTGESTILVVDDAALMRRRIEASLKAAGYMVYTCADGLEAWNWLQSHVIPTMVITDIEMPNMDGFTLINRCRQIGMDMPMLVVSSRVSDEWGREARRLGATDYLTKGFTTPQLLEKVGTIIRQAARERTFH